MKKEFSISKRKFLLGSFALAGAAIGLGSWKIWNDFGALPRGGFDSPNWHGEEFHNLMDEPVLAEKPNMEGGWLKFMFGRGDRYPDRPVKSVKSDLKSLADNEFVWLGHSSFLLRMNGKIICVDPVLAGRASPVPFTIPAWPGSMPFRASDFPHIDLLCISHDHWDHLDRLAVSALDWDRAICGLGVGSHFASWGLKKPLELDWNDKLQLDGLEIVFTPSQHFSGRGLTRNKSLWGGFVFNVGSSGAVYFTGDGGYGSHFGEIGKAYGPFDLVFPDSGQYNKGWPAVHMFPEQAAQAVLDARGKSAVPVHFGKFTLAWHPWDEPQKRFASAANKVGLNFRLPLIGEKQAILQKMGNTLGKFSI